MPDGTEIPTDEIIEGWTVVGGFPGDMVTGEPVMRWIGERILRHYRLS